MDGGGDRLRRDHPLRRSRGVADLGSEPAGGDYSRTYPLWENSTPTWDVGYTTTPETYGLSRELGEDLESWQTFFETHCNPFEGWDNPENGRRWHQDGERLTEWLRAEVDHFADVEPEFGDHRRDR